MSPLEIRILLHHYAIPSPYNGAETPSFIKEINDKFLDLGLIKSRLCPGENVYAVTDRGLAYVNGLMALPLPTCEWTIPAAQKGGG